MRIQISTNVSDRTRAQADALIQNHGYSLRDVVTIAIDRLYREEATMEQKLADQIYLEVYGHIDSKQHYHQFIAQIQDWLYDGDLDDNPDIQGLVEEWREYMGDE